MKRLLIMALAIMTGIAASAQTVQEEDLDAQYAVDLLAPGTAAPSFTLGDLNGKQVSLSDFRGRKVVLVFWASWCPDCRAEVPELKEMYSAADPAKVAFVSESFDRSFDTLKAFAAEQALPGVQLFDPAGKKESKVAADYGVKWIPSLYLIDENGRVALGTVVAAKVAAALGGNAPAPAAADKVLCTDESCTLP